MGSPDPALGRHWLAGGILVPVVFVAGFWLADPGPIDDPQPNRSGQVHIASVENNHTERVMIVIFTVDEERRIVDGNASTLPPSVENDYGLLDCRDGDQVANRLRILANTDGEPRYEIEEFVELEEGDCGERGGGLYTLRIEQEARLNISESGQRSP
jgi:hypothetical protein